MIDLNNKEEIKKIDPQDTLASTDLLPKQLVAAWEQVNSLSIPQDYSQIKNIVFCGMGASIYGALVAKALLGPKFPFPSELVSDYHLPDYVSENTLVVLTSYSGSTEEVLSCAEEAKNKGTKMLVLTKGGKLGDFAKENNIPSYIFDGELNPAGVPRLGNGYTIVGLLGLLKKAGVIDFDASLLENSVKNITTTIDTLKQKALDDSEKYVDTIPIIFAAEHLSGNAQIFRNQFNETSKQFSAYYLVPDLNHHLMEGLAFPKSSKLRFIAFQSQNYSPKIHKRMELTKDVVAQNNQTIDMYSTEGKNIFEDFLEVLAYGSYLTLFLGLRNGQNPAINPWVDYFKEQLSS